MNQKQKLEQAIQTIQRQLRQRFVAHEPGDYYPSVNIMIEKVELLDHESGIAADSESGVIEELLS